MSGESQYLSVANYKQVGEPHYRTVVWRETYDTCSFPRPSNPMNGSENPEPILETLEHGLFGWHFGLGMPGCCFIVIVSSTWHAWTSLTTVHTMSYCYKTILSSFFNTLLITWELLINFSVHIWVITSCWIYMHVNACLIYTNSSSAS